MDGSWRHCRGTEGVVMESEIEWMRSADSTMQRDIRSQRKKEL